MVEEGSVVTIDPALGRLWLGALPFKTPSPLELSGMTLLSELSLRLQKPTISFALSDLSDRAYLFQMGGFPLEQVLGLFRTEMWTHSTISRQFPNRVLGATHNQRFAFGYGAASWDIWKHQRDLNFRLPDLRSLEDLFHPHFTKGLRRGKDHKVGSIPFKTKLAFYRQLLRDNFKDLSDNSKAPLQATITVPNICTPQEVIAHRQMVVQEAHRAGLEDKLAFGVMMETREALAHTAAIAKNCDRLCYGTNDLTSEMTGLPRDEPDYADWMQARGYKGHSPFAFLIPEVRQAVARSVIIARRANPAIQISFCGQQMAGEDISALFFACRLGVDQIVVPPTFNARFRALAAALVHAARTGKLASPPRPAEDNDWRASLKSSHRQMYGGATNAG